MAYSDFLLVFLGGVSLMTLYIGAQAIITADRSYWYYTLYAGCWICFFIVKVLYTFEDARLGAVVFPFARIGFPMLGYVCYYRFAETFLDSRQTLPGVFRLFRWMQGVLLIYVGLELLVCVFETGWTDLPAHEWVHSAMRVAVAVASMAGIWQALQRRDAVTVYFVMGSVFLLLGALASMVLSFADRPAGTLVAWHEPLFWLNIGIVAELLCFSLGLSYKNKQTEIQKLTMEQEVLREREQHRAEQLKTQFFTNISHEFRTPLTLILGPITDLLRQQPGHKTYQLVHRNASRLLTLINQVLDLSRLDARQLQPSVQPGNLTVWLRVLVSSFISLADAEAINLTFETHSSAFEVAWFDRDKTEKIVTNLVANALRFTPGGGSVTVSLAASATGQAVIRVQDTGPGIPVDEQTKIFSRFHQVAGPNAPAVAAGTGIGLALVQELTGVLGGTVAVFSTPGQGAAFTVTLPVDAETWQTSARLNTLVDATELSDNGLQSVLPLIVHHTTDKSDAEPNYSTSITGKPLLLLVEDNPDMRQYLRQILASEYRIIEATNARDGLHQANAVPDIIICDWMISGGQEDMDGIAFCQTLKMQPATDHIPVIMLTAKATTANRIEGFRHGADDYLTKPVHADELRIRLQNLLIQRRKLRNHFSHELRIGTSSVPVLSVEERFLRQVIAVLEPQLGNSAFTIDQLAGAMNLSRMQLHRKLKALTSQSATEFVRHLRLQRAAELLAARSATVSEVAFKVGFESLSYFSMCFRKEFGVSPGAYQPVVT